MADQGSLPQPTLTRVHKWKFLKYGVTVLQSKNPEAERDVKKLPLKLQSKIAIMMGNKSCCMLCPAKATVFLEWDVFGCCWTPSEPRKCPQEAMDFYGIEVSMSLSRPQGTCVTGATQSLSVLAWSAAAAITSRRGSSQLWWHIAVAFSTLVSKVRSEAEELASTSP